MRKTMNALVVIAIAACMLIGFWVLSGSYATTIDELNEACDQGRLRLAELENEQAELKTMVETVGTDAFIENQARTLYGYMMPDEIRFVITNPQVLYGNE